MIRLENVTKYFKVDGEKHYVLKNVSFVIPSDTNVGILGRNGAGKSTLLRMLGGIDFPTVGKIISDKSFSWPMGLAGGFQGSMTGRQNVKFVCRIYGKSESETASIIDSVKAFSELEEYFELPIKLYSTGMRGRLSFGLSLAFDFDYLIIDETLSAGDTNFKNKAKEALEKKIEHCNVLLVSHSMGDLKRICDAGIIVNDGKLSYFEKIDDAIDAYQELNGFVPKSVPKPINGTIYSDDGKSFEGINAVAAHYKLRPYAVIQAINENSGSLVYLNRVFWVEGKQKMPFQNWQEIDEGKTIISSDGIIFADAREASLFYIERVPNVKIDKEHVQKVLDQNEGYSKPLSVQFSFLKKGEIFKKEDHPLKVEKLFYSSDGMAFETIEKMAAYYKVRPYAIHQSINHNQGSNVYLKKVFWHRSEDEKPYQAWPNVIDKKTILSSDGVVFANIEEAVKFYVERFPNANIDKMYLENILEHEKGFSKELQVMFYYLSEYQ